MTTTTKPEFKAPSDVTDAQAVKAHAVSPGALVGTWSNTDSSTRGLVKVVIAASGSGISVDAFGACTPTPCNWGAVAGTAYAANVSSSAAVAFSAQYKFSFKQTTVVGHLNGNLLTVETFDVFTDGSGRSSYYSQYQMHK